MVVFLCGPYCFGGKANNYKPNTANTYFVASVAKSHIKTGEKTFAITVQPVSSLINDR